MSKFLRILEATMEDKFVIHVVEGREDTDHFVDKNGKFTRDEVDENAPDDEKVKAELKLAKKFDSIEQASEYFKEHFKGFTNYKVVNDEYHTAKYKQYTIQILSTDHFNYLHKNTGEK